MASALQVAVCANGICLYCLTSGLRVGLPTSWQPYIFKVTPAPAAAQLEQHTLLPFISGLPVLIYAFQVSFLSLMAFQS